LQSAQKPDVEALQNKVSDFLTSNGFSEMMSMSLTKSKYLELAQDAGNGKETVVELLNPLSGDLAIMRQNLLYSGLEAIAYNRNHRNPDLRLYEFGKVYHKFGEKYNEEKRLALFLSGRKQQESWNNSNEDVSFSDLKGAFENILQSLRIAGARYQALESSSFDDALECSVGKNVLARLGCVSGSLLKSFDIKQTVWYAEILWENILKMIPKAEVKYREPEKFPAVRRDLSLLLDKSVKYAEIERVAMESEKKVLRNVNLFDVYEGKNLEAGKKSYAVSFVLQDSSKTMTDEQSEQAMARIQKALEEKLGATLRA
jgi:phenylalanyl-tRNA synthetase beta chain